MQTTKSQKKAPLQTKHSHKKCICATCQPPKPKLPVGTRRIKIQPKYVRRIAHEEAFPSILLSGKWLQEEGFKCDSYVIISGKLGELIIKLEKE